MPFRRDTICETWLKVKDDIELQERLVRKGNEFVEDFLRRERHELYIRETLRAISPPLAGDRRLVETHKA